MPDQDKDPKDLQIESLTKQVEALTKEKGTATAVGEKLVAELTTAKSAITELRDKVKTAEAEKFVLTKSVAEKDKQLGLAEKVVTDLKTKLAATEEKIEKLPQVEVDGVAYELLTDFKWAGQVVTIEVLKDNAKLAAELVREGVGNLRAVQD